MPIYISGHSDRTRSAPGVARFHCVKRRPQRSQHVPTYTLRSVGLTRWVMLFPSHITDPGWMGRLTRGTVIACANLADDYSKLAPAAG